MSKSLKNVIILTFLTILITFLVWLPHFLKFDNFYGLNFSNGFDTIYRNYDGLEYLIIAKTFYFPEILKTIPQSLPHQYYSAHFPGYSFMILFFSPLLGFLKSMVFVSVVFTMLSAIVFYFLIREFNLTSKPILLSIIFLILPARWLIVHSVGSAEPMFIFFVITSIYFFMKFEKDGSNKFIWLSSIFGALAQFTRPPGILLFISLGFYLIWKILKGSNVITGNGGIQLNTQIQSHNLITFNKVMLRFLKIYYPVLLIPITLLLIFTWFSISLNDFWAYFHSGDNIHLSFPPFQVFNKNQFWVGEIWLEDIIYIFILGFLGINLLFKQKLEVMGFFVLTYLTATIFVAHRDISRYALPIFPFLIIAFEKILTSREFRIVLIIIALAIYLYTQNFLIENTSPYPNLGVFN